MTPAEISALAASSVALLAVGGLVFKFGQLATKVDTMWEFQMRRAVSEGVKQGVLRRNSPIALDENAKQWMSGLAGQLRTFYARQGRRLTEADLALEIERRFGDRILHEVCIPNGLFQGSCLVIAMQIAKEVNQE